MYGKKYMGVERTTFVINPKGKIKKIFRDRAGIIGDADREALALELGDVLWYLAEICSRLGIRLEDVAEANIAKIADRVERGVLHGDGDRR